MRVKLFNENIEESVIQTMFFSPFILAEQVGHSYADFTNKNYRNIARSVFDMYWYKKTPIHRDNWESGNKIKAYDDYRQMSQFAVDVVVSSDYHGYTIDLDWVSRPPDNLVDVFNIIPNLYILLSLESERRKRGKSFEIIECQSFSNGLGAYYDSYHWKLIRSYKLSSSDNMCQICGNKKHLQCHHRTYERAKQELLSDLIILCRECHSFYHGKI